jgi:hypothetical protein
MSKVRLPFTSNVGGKYGMIISQIINPAITNGRDIASLRFQLMLAKIIP